MSSDAPISQETDAQKREGDECQGVRSKKRRRGKKKKFRSFNPSESGMVRNEESDQNKELSVPERKKRQGKVLIRPVDVPKAPLNSTQFIMDDHDECHLYFSFETPDPHQSTTSETAEKKSEVTGNAEIEDAAFQDIDYEYHSMQDLDNSAYYLQDFEDSYFNMRCEELFRLSRPDLISAVESLESRLNDLEDKLFEQDPGSALEQLQQKLLHLQEQNVVLTTNNVRLNGLFKDDESHSERMRGNNLHEESGHAQSEGSHSASEHSGDDSDASFDGSEGNEDSMVSTASGHNFDANDSGTYVNGTNDFEHVAIEQSSDESSNEDNVQSHTSENNRRLSNEHSPNNGEDPPDPEEVVPDEVQPEARENS